MGFFQKRKIELTPSWQKGLQEELAKGEQYGGKFAAPMSAYEKTGLEKWLAPYLETPATGEMAELGKAELGKTLRGEYDPFTSPYYQSLRTGAKTNLEEIIDQIRGQKAAGEQFFTEERIRGEEKAGRDVTNMLNQILGQQFEQERARTFSALPLAMQYDEFLTQAPLKKVVAATTFGALPRQIEQMELEGKYQEFVRTKNQKLQMAGMQIQPDVYAPSDFEKTIDTAIRIGNMISNFIPGGKTDTSKKESVEEKIASKPSGYRLPYGGGTDFSQYLS